MTPQDQLLDRHDRTFVSKQLQVRTQARAQNLRSRTVRGNHQNPVAAVAQYHRQRNGHQRVIVQRKAKRTFRKLRFTDPLTYFVKPTLRHSNYDNPLKTNVLRQQFTRPRMRTRKKTLLNLRIAQEKSTSALDFRQAFSSALDRHTSGSR